MLWNWSNIWHFFTFQALPYIVITVLILGSILRWILAPYTWKTQSSELLGSKTSLWWGANLFHFGVIMLFIGHVFGLFTPVWFLDAIGLTPPVHQMTEVIAGGIAAAMTITGLIILLCRRTFNSRIRISSRVSDWIVDWLLIIVLCLGIGSLIYGAIYDQSGAKLVVLGNWAKSLMDFNPDAWRIMEQAPTWEKFHIVCGLLVFLIVPFTRLVHIWSGFFSPLYLFRDRQIMRRGGKIYND